MQTYLTKRGSTYYFRRVVPLELRGRYGKSEITFSLRTKDKAEAKRRCLEAAVQVQAELDGVSMPLPQAISVVAPAPKPLSRSQATALMYRAVQDKRNEAFRAGCLASEDKRWRDQIETYRAALRGEIDLGMSLEKIEGTIAGIEAALNGADDSELVSRAADFLARKNKDPEPAGKMLADVIPVWLADRSPTPKTHKMFVATCAAFEGVAGRKPLASYGATDVRAFMSSLSEAGRARSTIESRLNHLRALFRQAIGHGWMAVDPTANIKLPAKADTQQARRPFTVDELKIIFSSPVHSSSYRPKGGGGEAAYWLPLMALWTGARLNELGQLRVSDIVTENYLDADGCAHSRPFINIVSDEDDGLRLKNLASNRRVPVHDALISVGFMDYVEKQSRVGKKLFPDLVPDGQGVITGNWSKWFGRYLRETCGIADKRVAFHSFRHNFKDAARACSIPVEVSDALTGHSRGPGGGKYGWQLYPSLPLAQGIDRLRILGFQIPTNLCSYS